MQFFGFCGILLLSLEISAQEPRYRGSFTIPHHTSLVSVHAGDVDGNGKLDLVATTASQDVTAETVRGALDGIFDRYPGIRHYILDDQGHVRHHVQIFVDGKLIADRDQLSDAVDDASEVSILQALSGG